MKKRFILATASLIGTIIGAGIFSVPFAFAQVGFWRGLFFLLVLSLVMVILHVMFAEIIGRTKENHRLIGYVKIYLGEKAKNISALFILFGLYGGLIIYILLANEFLTVLFGPLLSQNYLWGFVFWALLSLGIIKGLKIVARLEVFMLGFLVLTLFIIIFGGAPSVDASNFSGGSLNLSTIPLVYGVILMSLAGFDAIPEMRDILGKNRKLFPRAIIAGVGFSALVTLVFAIVVVGVSGINTSEEAVAGLVDFLGEEVAYMGAIFGLLTIASSYLVFGVNMKESYMYDWGFSKRLSAFLVLSVPIVVILLGVRDFVQVIMLTGGVIGAINGILIVALFNKAKKHGDREPAFSISVPKLVVWVIVAILLTGGLYEILYALS